MTRSRPMRRLISSLAVIMMVLCQSAALAATCVTAASQTDRSTTVMPCHESGNAAKSDSSDNACPGQCQTSQVSPEFPKVGADTAADLPLLTTYADIMPVAASCAAPYDTRWHHAASPPLPIVLCRLLN